MARSEKSQAAQREQFLAALSQTASVTRACEIASLPRRTVYNWRAMDVEFARAWEVALDLGTDALEDEAIRRATQGTERPVFQGKQLVGHTRDFSDTLLIFMLKARRPEKYRERHTPAPASLAEQALIEMVQSLTRHNALPLGSIRQLSPTAKDTDPPTDAD